MSDHGLYFSNEGQQRAANGQISCGVFQGYMHMALDGWVLARVAASLAQGLPRHGPRYFIFPYFVHDVWP